MGRFLQFTVAIIAEAGIIYGKMLKWFLIPLVAMYLYYSVSLVKHGDEMVEAVGAQDDKVIVVLAVGPSMWMFKHSPTHWHFCRRTDSELKCGNPH